jgi:hypothetical protein
VRLKYTRKRRLADSKIIFEEDISIKVRRIGKLVGPHVVGGKRRRELRFLGEEGQVNRN